MPINYKYSEDTTLLEMKQYVDATYGEHYASKNGVQVMDLIDARGHGTSFSQDAIIKYAYRYGLKGGNTRKDLLKIIHYAMFLLHFHDRDINGK